MEPTMSELAKLEALDFAALLCSRVCHDIISPVGAITNGLEVLDEENNEEMKAFAFDLIRKSARTASSKLQFARLAFGAAGSVGAEVDLGDAEIGPDVNVGAGTITCNYDGRKKHRRNNCEYQGG